MKDYYKILGVSRQATQKEIKSAYRSLAKKHHPDATGEESDDQFKDIQEAYSTLSDPEKRSDYDACLGERVRVRIRTSSQRRYSTGGAFSRPEPLIPRDPFARGGNAEPFRSSAFEDADDLFDRLRTYLFRRFFLDDDDFWF